MSSTSEYLGYPKDESEWLCYQGTCVLFAGNKDVFENSIDDSDYEPDFKEWILESEEETKRRLIVGLQTVGVRCAEITIKWTDEHRGMRCCECICYYNKPYQIYHSDFFIDAERLSAFDFVSGPFEFGFDKRM